MNRTEAIAWVLSVCANYLRLSQAKTLSDLVGAALHIGRVSLGQIGRLLIGSANTKSRIKRVERFVANPRVTVYDSMRGVVAKLLKRKGKRKSLLVALDWTEIRNIHTLAACAILKGRAVPLLWASYPEWELFRSQNNMEEALLRLLRTMIPDDVQVIVLADRGFGRTELARLCQELGLRYVVRISPDVWVHGKGFDGKLLDYPIRKGDAHLLRNLAYRKNDPVTQNVAILWKRGLPARRDEAWFLMTDLTVQDPWRLAKLYGKRMTIEECFRDHKSQRNGFALRQILVSNAERIDRLLLILVLAYLLLTGLGLLASTQYRPSAWSRSNRLGQCSAFTIGRIMLDRMKASPSQVVAALVAAIANAARNWG